MSDMFTEIEELIATLRKFKVDIVTALGYGGNTHTYEHVCAQCLTGHYDTLILPNSVIISELFTYPTHKVYNVFIAAGDLDEIIEAQNGTLIREAKLRGATALTAVARKGWAKALENHGWTSSLVYLRKELKYGKVERAKDGADAEGRQEPSEAVQGEFRSRQNACGSGLSAV